MRGLFCFSTLLGLLLGAELLSSPAARAQTAIPAAAPAARGYDFLTVTTVEGTKAFSFLLFSPAFQGKNEVQLESGSLFSADKYKERIQHNNQIINEQLSALTVAGWELVQVYTPISPTDARCYLFRKAKN